MKKRHMTKTIAFLVTLIMCVTMVMPMVTATDAAGTLLKGDVTAPLEGLDLSDAAKESTGLSYTFAPVFRQNTRSYTVTISGTDAAKPADAAEAEALLKITLPTAGEGETATTSQFSYNSATGLATIVTTKGTDSSIYYVSFTAQAEKSDTAKINILKILQSESGDVLDSLGFTYYLIPNGIVGDTSTVANNMQPIATPTPDDDDTTNGNVVVANGRDNNVSTETYSVMTMTEWDKVTTTYTGSEADLSGKLMVEGVFQIRYNTVGKYVYTLYEVKGTTTGVIYDETKYEVIVYVVNQDPSDVTKGVCVGWIEVRKTTTDEGEPLETSVKVNFPTDSEKYDSSSASVTYPFVNTIDTEDIVISKLVTGDLGDRDQGFLFEITLAGTDLASEYAVQTSNPGASAGQGTVITDTATTGTSAEQKAVVILKHGGSVTLSNVPVGTTYTVKELVADLDSVVLVSAGEAANYNTSITYDASVTTGEAVITTTKGYIVGKDLANATVLDTATGPNGRNLVEYVNDKPLNPPTGVVLDMIPYVIITAVAAVGIVAYVVFSKRRRASEY